MMSLYYFLFALLQHRDEKCIVETMNWQEIDPSKESVQSLALLYITYLHII